LYKERNNTHELSVGSCLTALSTAQIMLREMSYDGTTTAVSVRCPPRYSFQGAVIVRQVHQERRLPALISSAFTDCPFTTTITWRLEPARWRPPQTPRHSSQESYRALQPSWPFACGRVRFLSLPRHLVAPALRVGDFGADLFGSSWLAAVAGFVSREPERVVGFFLDHVQSGSLAFGRDLKIPPYPFPCLVFGAGFSKPF